MSCLQKVSGGTTQLQSQNSFTQRSFRQPQSEFDLEVVSVKQVDLEVVSVKQVFMLTWRIGEHPGEPNHQYFPKSISIRMEGRIAIPMRGDTAIQMRGVLRAFPLPQGSEAPKVLQNRWGRTAIAFRSSGWGF